MPKTVLIAPLNWGLGHASRCVPIINALLNNGDSVILASDGVALALLKQEFPDLSTEELPSYGITYPKNGNFIIHMATLVPRILKAIKQERITLAKLISKYQIDVVISDNRYGMYHESVKSIYLTHQIKVAAPMGEDLLASLQQKFIANFDKLWIPDVEGDINLSGKLAHNDKVGNNAKYIGALSRFTENIVGQKPENAPNENFVLAVISGPEPQRTAFEVLLFKQLLAYGKPAVIVGGNPNDSSKSSKNITHYPFLGAKNLKWLFENAETIICRSGYSTIMDLVALQKQAILIPTPGQTEQEYLVNHLSNSGMFVSVSQKDFEVKTASNKLKTLSENHGFSTQKFTLDLSQIINTI